MGAALLCVESPDPPFVRLANVDDSSLVAWFSGLPKSTSDRLSIYLQPVILDWDPSVESWNPAS